ncbi:MAG: hypothetical protein A2Y41_11705 [Spirochaetes bacterium GWB1_36_13]|nr:MAG: hypothetical protein A2Y41_11705 [Spirochaetes bacterium GWB1_36_13]
MENKLYPPVRFIVISDLHYYSKILGIEGKEFERYKDNDPKFLEKSEEVIDQLLAEIKKEEADFILIAGDLTKDGEKICHLKLLEKLQKLKDSGEKVFLINGNHDILNKDALSFSSSGVKKVETVNGKEFEEIYRDFGFQDAFEKDTDSLSYVVEPVNGLWVLALDSCLWKKQNPNKKPITGGEISLKTLFWVEKILKKASDEKKSVIVFTHHGLFEHYKGNKKYYPEFILSNPEKLIQLFHSYQVSFVFTGHFHAQNIAVHQDEKGHEIFDIETGSPLTFPCPYRIVEISPDSVFAVMTKTIQSIQSDPDWEETLFHFTLQRVYANADKTLKKFLVPLKDRKILSLAAAKAYLSHLEGSVNREKVEIPFKKLSLRGKAAAWMKKDLIEAWQESPFPDNNFFCYDLVSQKVIKS